MGDDKLDIRVFFFDLHHLRQVDPVAQAPVARDMEHHQPAVAVDDLQLMRREEIIDADFTLRDIVRRQVQVGLDPQEFPGQNRLLKRLRRLRRVGEVKRVKAVFSSGLRHITVG